MEQRLLIPLDVILDTRLGTLIDIDELEAKKIIENGYRQRKSDEWTQLGSSIAEPTYRAAYDQRQNNERILKLSRLTGIVPLLLSITQRLTEQSISTPYAESIVFEINFYPYRFTQQVQDELLDGLYQLISPQVQLQGVRISDRELTPHHIKNRYSAIFLYDFNFWLDAQYQNLQATPIPEVTVFIPSLYCNKVPDEEELRNDEDEPPVSPFRALEMTLAAYMALEVLDAKYFSLIDVD